MATESSQGLISGTPSRSQVVLTNFLKKWWWLITVVLLLVLMTGVAVGVGVARNKKHKGEAGGQKNVIFMISDGMGPAAVTLGRQWLGTKLNLDSILIGTVRTKSSDNLVTDSAAAATAYSCGVKTYNDAIGVDSSGEPCGTILEAAKRKGMKTGLITTKSITDATPAAFSSHSVWRWYEEFIAEQQVALGVDVLLGGGLKFFSNLSRTDNKDLIGELTKKGYTVVYNAADLSQVKKAPLVGLFSPGDFPFVIDRIREGDKIVPSLAAMTEKAIELLSQEAGDAGFFLMVEGAEIDIAGHLNDAATQVHEFKEYDEALGLVKQFADEDGSTVVLGTSDHDTGGLALGYQSNPLLPYIYGFFPDRLDGVTASCNYMASLIGAGQSISSVLNAYANITDLSDNELQLISQANATNKGSLPGIVGNIVSTRAYIGFSTHGHTGVDVNLYGYHLPIEFGGNIENIDLSTYIQDILDLDVPAVTESLADFDPNPPSQKKVESNTHDFW
eukprot:TRINITY_DN4512_c0_g1_i1.p1 TRINITY_DN4512_c0_g1~~TRINITY_DN4512_c0_g1_i1.p1  ORF type:complete len:503 (+),score=106.63 TRINITY_DN4512_c0_g1_i1:170-1678(+)